MSKQTLRRTIHPQTRVLDAPAGLVEYVASDETCDSYNEVIRARGWKFDLFEKNAPFVDSHKYDSIEHLLGKVVDFQVKGGQLVETVKWAVDAGLPETHLANIGFRMTAAGHLKAVSVGFFPEEFVTPANQKEFQKQLGELKLAKGQIPSRIFTRQQQVELSSCVIGANPNALARAFKAEVITEADLNFLEKLNSREKSRNEIAGAATRPADAALAYQRARLGLTATIINLAEQL